MTIKVGINGFGRIGRMVFRRAINDPTIDIVAINASYTGDVLAHLIKYDTIQGIFSGEVSGKDNRLVVNGKTIEIVNHRDPIELPWKNLGVEIVVEATGKFNQREGAYKHIEAGAKKVVLTAPGKDEDITIVMGVNEKEYISTKHHIVSNASCTTNCLAPIVKVIDDVFGIESGLMTTVHSYTNDQNNLDNPHKDLRRARACGQSIIPTTTGAAKAVSKVLPHLEGKLNGLALRVPTPNVSLVDLVANLSKEVTVDKINIALKKASLNGMAGVVEYSEAPLVSSDYIGNSSSAIVDGLSTMVMGERQCKIMAWYDNEWGYSSRVVDLVKYIGLSN
ncbi:glyceraldehyde-3-phosphate dehydrogenase [Alkalicella caledoniensis]|uniref:Glyceraldehyde-3-phosphate dehydrogenase n=1 Tax=Alkalicella caledoniensis TaxID=2731377 RepID=A0A7G9W981_ALKCA|nr:glyceraldehyde-3-phosphate dehydrogenase [Alkalicella caledoniensis]QNO15243.1 glyceraldehyde-3-phosphate dehydrogenase [Alkalicella caledoniensis]